jgi:hypothetical protein
MAWFLGTWVLIRANNEALVNQQKSAKHGFWGAFTSKDD